MFSSGKKRGWCVCTCDKGINIPVNLVLQAAWCSIGYCNGVRQAGSNLVCIVNMTQCDLASLTLHMLISVLSWFKTNTKQSISVMGLPRTGL